MIADRYSGLMILTKQKNKNCLLVTIFLDYSKWQTEIENNLKRVFIVCMYLKSGVISNKITLKIMLS